MVYQIKEHNYEMPREQYLRVIKMLKGQHKGLNVILAVEKDGIAIALRKTQRPARCGEKLEIERVQYCL